MRTHGKDGQVINRPHDLARWAIMEERDVYKAKGLGRENWEVNFCACSFVKLFDVKVFENPCGYIKVINIRKILQAAPTLRPHHTLQLRLNLRATINSSLSILRTFLCLGVLNIAQFPHILQGSLNRQRQSVLITRIASLQLLHTRTQ